MQSLSPIDTLFCFLDSPRYPMHGLGVLVLDPSTAPEPLTYERVREHVRRRLPLLPPMRRRLVERPLGVDRPLWFEDPEFDLDAHLHHVAVPAPGDDRTLARLAADVGDRPLDRERPLWELWVVEGLEGDRVALLLKMHHACIDGMGGLEMLMQLFDLEADADPEPPEDDWVPDRLMSQWELFVRSVPNMLTGPLRSLRSAAGLVSGIARGRLVRSGDASEAGHAFAGPKVSFNHVVRGRPHRNLAWSSVDMGDVKTVRRAFDATVNDVALALCSGAIRYYLADRGELPARSLTAANPVNLREQTDEGQFENRVKIMGPLLETQIEDPAERLRAIVRSTKDTKRASAATGTNLFEDLFGITMPGLVDQLVHLYSASGLAGAIPAPYNTTITNLMGPPVPLYFAGARLDGFHIQMMLFDGVGLVIALISYAGRLVFNVTATRELTPDVWTIAEGIETEMRHLLAVSDTAATA